MRLCAKLLLGHPRYRSAPSPRDGRNSRKTAKASVSPWVTARGNVSYQYRCQTLAYSTWSSPTSRSSQRSRLLRRAW